MSIKFSCPKCNKTYILPDDRAGKRAKCAGCQQVIVVPAPVAAPADAEELAAAAFADEPKAQEAPKSTKTIDVDCAYCGEKVKFSADLAGKQAPCPECRRIIKVPQLVEDKPKDWRKSDNRLPSGARRDDQPAPEGAWGSTTDAGKVSRQSLIEAEVIKEEREPWSYRQLALIGSAALVAVLFIGGGIWYGRSLLGQNRQQQAIKFALEAIAANDDNKGSPLTAAVVHRAAGEFQLRTNSQEGLKQARREFGEASRLLAQAAASRERDLLLIEVALSQVELGGDKKQVQEGTRLEWQAALKEVAATLQPLPAQEAEGPQAQPGMPLAGPRVLALKEVCHKLAAVGQGDAAAEFALSAIFPSDPSRPEGLGHLGLALARNNSKEAERLADALAGAPAAAGGAPPVPPTPSLVGLIMVLNRSQKLQEMAPLLQQGDKPTDVGLLGTAIGWAYQGRAGEARQRLAAASSPLLRLRGLVAIAAAQEQAPNPPADVLKEAADLLSREFKAKPAPAGLVHELALVGVRANLADEAKQVAALSPDPAVRNHVGLQLLRARLAATQGLASDAWADEGIDKQSAFYGVAREEIARHNARQDASVYDAVKGWDESVRPFGLAGVALGLQDAK